MATKKELQGKLEQFSDIIGVERSERMMRLEQENDYLQHIIDKLLRLIETMSNPKDMPGVTHYHYYNVPPSKNEPIKIIDLSREQQIEPPVYNPGYKIPDTTSNSPDSISNPHYNIPDTTSDTTK